MASCYRDVGISTDEMGVGIGSSKSTVRLLLGTFWGMRHPHCMTEELTIITERANDAALLLTHGEQEV
jgi:hypothetical protein